MLIVSNYEISDYHNEHLFISGGYFQHEMSLNDYWKELKDSVTPYLHYIVFDIVKNNIRTTMRESFDFDHTQHNYDFAADGVTICFTDRAYADLLAAVWSEIDEQCYSYLDFLFE